MTNDQFPWDKHAVSPEAKALVAKAEAHATMERLDRDYPIRARHRLLVALGVIGIIALPLLLLSLAFDLSGFLRRIF